jgi:hypothetical protein
VLVEETELQLLTHLQKQTLETVMNRAFLPPVLRILYTDMAELECIANRKGQIIQIESWE